MDKNYFKNYFLVLFEWSCFSRRSIQMEDIKNLELRLCKG